LNAIQALSQLSYSPSAEMHTAQKDPGCQRKNQKK